MKFTNTQLTKIKTRSNSYWIREDGSPGFTLRVSPKGKLTFYSIQNLNGKKLQKKLGVFPQVSIEEARAAWAIEAAQSNEIRETGHATVTLEYAVQEYKKDAGKRLRPSTLRDYWRHLDALLTYRNYSVRAVTTLTRANIMDVVTEGGENISGTTQNRKVSTYSALFTFMVKRGWRESSPLRGVERQKENVRETTLSWKTQANFLIALDNSSCNPSVKDAVEFIFLTGSRLSEVTDLTWKELDLKAGTWTLPVDRSKNHLEKTLPLPPQLLQKLRTNRMKAPPSQTYVFTSQYGNKIGKYSIGQAIERLCQKHGLKRFTPHDIRRTVATELVRGGFTPEFVATNILNHTKKTVAEIHYIKYDYMKEKKRAIHFLEKHYTLSIEKVLARADEA